jgi:hypothetical protein
MKRRHQRAPKEVLGDHGKTIQSHSEQSSEGKMQRAKAERKQEGEKEMTETKGKSSSRAFGKNGSCCLQ